MPLIKDAPEMKVTTSLENLNETLNEDQQVHHEMICSKMKATTALKAQ
jgi:hypothetical protein